MANNDTLLAVTLHIDDSTDMDAFSSFLKTLHHYFYAVGHLFVIIEQDFLADNLGNKETGRFVGELFLVKIGGTLW